MKEFLKAIYMDKGALRIAEYTVAPMNDRWVVIYGDNEEDFEYCGIFNSQQLAIDSAVETVIEVVRDR